MPRRTLGPFVGGADLQSDPSIMGAQFSPNPLDISMARGICETRAGYRVLDAEPSYLASGTPKSARQTLTFDAAQSESGSAAFVRPLKNTFSIIYEGLPTDTSDGTYIIAAIHDGSNLVMQLEYVVLTSTVAYRLRVRDSSGNVYTGVTPAKTTGAWGATRRYVTAVFFNGAAIIYVGGVSQTITGAGSSTGVFSNPTAFYLSFDGTTNYASQAISQFVLVNRSVVSAGGNIQNYTEQEVMQDAYFPLGYPVDSIENDPDILLHYTFTENTGTTVYDWSQFGTDLTLANTPTWVTGGGQHLSGRGLGMGVWRTKDGTRYNVLGFTRNSPRTTTNVKQGVVYVDRCDATWRKSGADLNKDIYLIGGSTIADQTSPFFAGFDSFARMQFIQAGHRLVVLNGVDYIRQASGVTSLFYMGGTAPPTAPIIGSSGSGSNWKVCYTYYDPINDIETGRSPVATITDDALGTTVQWFLSSDPQFTQVRIYRTVSDGTRFYLETTQAMAASAYALAVTDANIVAMPILVGDGSAEGNRKVKRLYLAFPDFSTEDGTGSTRAPVAGPTLGVTGAGGSLSAGNYYVAYAYRNSTTGEESGMSPATLQATSANDRIDVSNLVLPGNSNYNQIVMYRTKVNAFTWYEDKVITAATTTTLTQADSTLATTIETKGLPPVCPWGVIWANRLWLLGVDGTLYWSTAGDYGSFPFENAHRGRGRIGGASLVAAGGILLVAYEDGVVYALPSPGSETNLSYFVVVNFQLFSDSGGCIAQDTVRSTDIGILWLGVDGVYRFDGQVIGLVSQRMTPYFRYLNLGRARYATALWKDDEHLYMIAVPRGFDRKARLNDSWACMFTVSQSWMPYQLPPCDVLGILEDERGNSRYCFQMPSGLLCELLTKSQTQQRIDPSNVMYDGVEVQTAANLANATACSFDAPTYTAPAGFDGGFAAWLLRNEVVSSITNNTVQRWVLRNGTPFLSGLNFYPMCSTVIGNTFKGYLGGIRSQWVTARFSCIPDEPERYCKVLNTYTHQKIDPFSGSPSIQAVLTAESPTQNTLFKIPTIMTAPATFLGIQHTVTLTLVEDGVASKLQTQHGGWDGVGIAFGASSTGRSHQFLFVNNPPEPNVGFVVQSVAFEYEPQESA